MLIGRQIQESKRGAWWLPVIRIDQLLGSRRQVMLLM